MHVVILALLTCTAAETTNPVQRVVELVQNLKTKIKEDAKKEQAVYDKYACWCEKTTERTTAAIAEAKALIEDRSTYILEAKGRLGSAGAEIANFKKQIAENLEAQGAAESLRKKENTDYLKTKGALEQGISNLDKAITVLGAATSSKGASHLSGSHPELGVMETNAVMETDAVVETRMLTVAAGVRSAMRLYAKHNNDDMNLRSEDFAVVKNFLSSPGAYVQMGSPHKGEYQSQSQGIQGILKDMHDSFQRDLADAIEEEKAKQADYDSLMKTKREDEVLLKSTLTKKDTSEGDDTKGLADANTEREETQAQLKSDEELLETTTTSCKAKANEWAERSRLRSEELAGINEAIDILTSPDAVATFATADSTFVQTRSVKTDSSQTKAYNILKDTASKTQNVRLAMLASKVYAGEGSHFDKVIEDIEKMISKLRDEEQSDIDHKDWCESERNKANTQNEDLEYAKDSLDKGMKRSGAKIAELNKEHAATKKDMSDLKKEMEDALDVRNAENAAFKDSIKADTDAVTLLTKAIGALSKFYEKNALLQKQDPEYTTDENKPPEAEFTSATSSGSTNTGIVSTLGGIKEDLVNEMKVARTEEAEADAAYRKLLKESQDAMDAMDRKCVDLKASIAEQNKLISDLQETYDDKQAQKDATDDYLDDLKENCDWIMNEFETRKKQRKDELAGLDDAKSALAGMKSALVTKKSVVTKGQTVSQSRVADALADLDSSEKELGMSFLQRKRI